MERLLEGVAFLTAGVRQKLDDEFPEFLHQWAQLIAPHHVQPVPCATVVAFAPVERLSESVHVASGTVLASRPVEGTPCRFSTTAHLDVHPLTMKAVRLEETPAGMELVLSLDCDALVPNAGHQDKVRLFLGGDFAEAVSWFAALFFRTLDVRVGTPDSGYISLGKAALRWPAFAGEEAFLPYPSQSYPGFRLLHEYFALPERFLFCEVVGLSAWRPARRHERGFELRFAFGATPEILPAPAVHNFVLHAVPVINLFSADATPLSLDHRQHEYRVVPSGSPRGHREVFSVDGVVGRGPERGERVYAPVDVLGREEDHGRPLYQVSYRPAIDGLGREAYLSVLYGSRAVPDREVMSVRLTCCNRTLPEALQVNEPLRAGAGAPEQLAASNIVPVTGYLPASASIELLTKVIAHQTLTHFPLDSAANFRSLLELYVCSGPREWRSHRANRARIAGIEGMETREEVRVAAGAVRRGRHILLRCNGERFINRGDLLLFGCVLEAFLGRYVGPGGFVAISLQNTYSGENFEWLPRVS